MCVEWDNCLPIGCLTLVIDDASTTCRRLSRRQLQAPEPRTERISFADGARRIVTLFAHLQLTLLALPLTDVLVLHASAVQMAIPGAACDTEKRAKEGGMRTLTSTGTTVRWS